MTRTVKVLLAQLRKAKERRDLVSIINLEARLRHALAA